MRVGEAGDDVNLAKKPFGSDRSRELGLQDLKSNPAVELLVMRQVHVRHGAGAEHSLNLVSASQARSDILDWEAQLALLCLVSNYTVRLLTATEQTA